MKKMLLFLLLLAPFALADVVTIPGSGSSSATITAGTSTVTGATSCLMYANASSTLQCASWLAAVDAGAGTPTITFTKTPSGSSTTSNFLNITATHPSTLTTATYGVLEDITTSGASTFPKVGHGIFLNAGATESGGSTGLYVANLYQGNSKSAFGILGFQNDQSGTSTNAGIVGITPTGTSRGFGVLAVLTSSGDPTLSAPGINGGLVPTLVGTAALGASNHNGTNNILNLYDSTTLKVAVIDGGNMALYNMALTAGTMAVERNSQALTTTHSATWTNAQVVALGAATTGNITAFTLPAKTVVENAYVVITGQGAGTTTLTVSCGRTAAGYIDYIVASDAKAAANTVYGDASGERGTNLTGYDLPSYTATTDVICQFVSTGANLDQVTGSTGRLILKTSLVP